MINMQERDISIHTSSTATQHDQWQMKLKVQQHGHNNTSKH